MPKFVLWSTWTHDEHEKNIVCLEEDIPNLCIQGVIDTKIHKIVMVWYDKDLASAKETARSYGYSF
jgi:hypothetical protein